MVVHELGPPFKRFDVFRQQQHRQHLYTFSLHVEITAGDVGSQGVYDGHFHPACVPERYRKECSQITPNK